jgi:hypothetical protein
MAVSPDMVNHFSGSPYPVFGIIVSFAYELEDGLRMSSRHNDLVRTILKLVCERHNDTEHRVWRPGKNDFIGLPW